MGATLREKKALEHMNALIMANSLDIICTIGVQGKFLKVSAASLAVLGYNSGELIGRSFIDLVYPEDMKITQTTAKSVMEGIATRDFENRYVHKNGTLVSLMWSAFWSDRDNVMIAVARDITARKRNDEALFLRERALGEVSQGVIICDENRLIIYANSSFTKITGYKETELLGESCSILQGADTEVTTILKMRSALHAGRTFEGEILNYRKDGREFWNDLSIAPIHSETGGPLRFIGILRDITARKQAEQELFFALERLQLAVKAGRVGTWDFNLLTHKMDWDEQMLMLYGRKSADITPCMEEWHLSIHPDDRAGARAVYDSAMSSGKDSFEREFRIIRIDDGLQRYIRGMGVILRDESGEAVRMIGINWDVTEERRREEKLSAALTQEKELSEKARSGERAKSEFLAVMSHEVRTPLNGILGFSELLAQTPDLPLESKDYVQIITSSGHSLLRILDDILDFSRLEADHVEIEKAGFASREILEDVRVLFAQQIKEKELTLCVLIDESIPDSLEGDVGRLRQILLNLVGNALKFTDQGTINVGMRLASDGVMYEFFVSDTGSGITAAQLSRIFEPFTQADSSISRRHGGTGLGLSISRRLAELMGGTLEVHSELNKGSEF
ncbi:MAG: PAS domain S-box protein, partial [Chthoniobacterales bacterium]